MIDGKELIPTPPPRVGQLDSLKSVRLELGRIYKDARQGRIETLDASRLAFVLVSLGKLIEQGDLEARIEALERAAEAVDQEQRRIP
ncbi:MAG: hypothetical protein ACRERD_33190 [Candidatus Binatia bacterium]